MLTLHQTFLSELQEADNSFTESFLSFIPFMKVPLPSSFKPPSLSPSSLLVVVVNDQIYTAYFNAYSQVSTSLAKLHSNSAFISLLKVCLLISHYYIINPGIAHN